MNTRADIIGEPPEGALTAAEFVLGVLDASARRDAQARAQRDAAFAAEIRAWEERFAPLLDEIVPVPVPFALWPKIQAAIGIAESSKNDASHAGEWWQSLRLWRWLSVAGFAAAAASFAALFLATRAPTPVPASMQELVATMQQDDGKPLFTATIDAASGKLIVMPLGVSIPADRTVELWLIPPGDKPHSLGLIDAQHAWPVLVPTALRSALAAKALVAVSIEPPGGAPHGQPTGPIIAKGEIALL
ncbi:MAG: anti-sigma factor [Gammaproteobacteria bacterium]|nr:MAG: anti-sigma factor [Gammaproteobacteria bacterium]